VTLSEFTLFAGKIPARSSVRHPSYSPWSARMTHVAHPGGKT
jgi:hypothetical protein